MSRVPTLLAEIVVSPTEVVTLVDRLDNAAQQNPKRTPFAINKNDIELKGYFEVDLKSAKPSYSLGALRYGPIGLSVYIDLLKIKIDWHKKLGIPKRACITIAQACGEKLEVCWNWDFGVSHVTVIDNLLLASSPMVDLIDVDFREDGDETGFQLYGDIQLLAALIDLFTTGVIRSFNNKAADIVERILRDVLGGGAVAKIFIEIIMWAFKAVDGLIGFFQKLVSLVLKPLEELLHAVLGDAIEIKLSKDPPFPRALPIMKKDGKHSEVLLTIGTPPDIDIGPAGVTLKVFA